MADKLVIEERGGGYCIGWWLEDDRDLGLVLGPYKDTLKQDPTKVSREELETVLATQAIHNLTQPNREVYQSEWIWDSEASAQAALRVAKEAIKAGVVRPMPDWAVKALEAGWKPPKGWKP